MTIKGLTIDDFTQWSGNVVLIRNRYVSFAFDVYDENNKFCLVLDDEGVLRVALRKMLENKEIDSEVSIETALVDFDSLFSIEDLNQEGKTKTTIGATVLSKKKSELTIITFKPFKMKQQ